MKKLIAIVCLTLAVTTAYGAIRCVPSGGGTCCWDTERDGPFKPIGC